MMATLGGKETRIAKGLEKTHMKGGTGAMDARGEIQMR